MAGREWTDSQGRSMEAQEKSAPQAAPILKAAELPLNGCAGNRMTRRKLPTMASFAAYHAVHGK